MKKVFFKIFIILVFNIVLKSANCDVFMVAKINQRY